MSIKRTLCLIALLAIIAYLGVWAYNLWFATSQLPPAQPERATSHPSSTQSQDDAAPPFLSTSISSQTGELTSSVAVVTPSADQLSNDHFTLSATQTRPGGLLTLSFYGTPQANIEVNNPFGVPPSFFAVDGHHTALIPVSAECEPALYTLSASVNGIQKEFAITVEAANFPVQHLTVDESVVSSTVQNTSANDEYFAKVQPLKFESIDHPLWEGDFICPIAGEFHISSAFGLLRTVNGKPSDRHGGLDYACPKGVPVLASNNGRVLFAQKIALTGNTVMLEHGLGLKTWYYHMDSLSVKEGDEVSKGQQLGVVGETGFATGPHLHFAVSVFRVYLDPNLLLAAAPSL